MKTIRKDKLILKKVEKTKEELYPDLESEHIQRMAEEKVKKVAVFRAQKKTKQEEEKVRKEESEIKSYKTIMTAEEMKSNKVRFHLTKEQVDDDDFM